MTSCIIAAQRRAGLSSTREVPDDQQPPDSDPHQRRPLINTLEGSLLFLIGRQDPDIPEEKQVSCPQCGATAGTESRWCWRCGYDFARARLGRCHPIKLLAMSLLLNVLLAGLALLAWHFPRS